MTEKEPITIYWASAMYNPDRESWAMAYPDPVSVYTRMRRHIPTADVNRCPAYRGLLKNVYSFDSAVDEDFELPIEMLRTINKLPDVAPVESYSRLGIRKIRPTAIEDYANIEYGLAWALFASEPLSVRITAPYYPVHTPVAGAYFSAGEYDIGRWYRPINADYHVPLHEIGLRFKINKGEPLLFLEPMTDRPVQFKRYEMTERLFSMLMECINAPARYGMNQPLEERYETAENSSMASRVLSEIRKNLV